VHPQWFNVDPDQAFYLNADPDPEPGSQTNADPYGLVQDRSSFESIAKKEFGYF
jgi:hypothetical protein